MKGIGTALTGRLMNAVAAVLTSFHVSCTDLAGLFAVAARAGDAKDLKVINGGDLADSIAQGLDFLLTPGASEGVVELDCRGHSAVGHVTPRRCTPRELA